VKSDIPIVDEKGRTLMAWNGSVNLQDRRIVNFNTAVAKQLLADLPILRNNEKMLPAMLSVPISGPFDKPKVDLIGAVTSSIVPGLGGGGKPEDLIERLPDLLGGGKKDKNKSRGDEPITPQPRDSERSRDRRSSADDGRDMGEAGRDNTARGGAGQPQDPVGGLLDLAGGLLNQGKPKDGGARDSRDRRDSRDATGGREPRGDADRPRDLGEDRISGDDRISGGTARPSTDDARTARDRRVSGDEPVSGRPRATTTTAPSTTAPAERNVSGRTKAARNRDGQ
jgi:hypothetical protein